MPAGTPIDIGALVDNLDLEQAVQIDIPELDRMSNKDANTIVSGIADLYYNPEWIKAHPQVKRRIDIELETLRGLIKMRRADEQAQDAILNGISSNNTNASLYRSLAEIQRASLAVTKQIDDTIEILDRILKGYQLEIPFGAKNEETDEPDDTQPPIHRGSKAFIEEQIKQQ